MPQEYAGLGYNWNTDLHVLCIFVFVSLCVIVYLSSQSVLQDSITSLGRGRCSHLWSDTTRRSLLRTHTVFFRRSPITVHTHTLVRMSSIWILEDRAPELFIRCYKMTDPNVTSKGILLSLTLAHAAALLPGTWGVPHKLHLVLLYRNVKGITYIRTIEVAHTQNLKMRPIRKKKSG